MLEGYFVQSCQLISPTRNEYGDYITGSSTTIPCRFRYIDTIRSTTHEELNDSDAMLWVAETSGVIKGSIIGFEGLTYQVERLNKARRLGETTIQFLKCDLKITDIGIS